MTAKPDAGSSTWTDPDDAPELTDAFFQTATVRDGSKIIRRGRPKTANPKTMVTLRLDTSVLNKLRALGPGWQTRANAILRDALDAPESHRQSPPSAD
jgi:uncharacterized protein (DUF4415 family)